MNLYDGHIMSQAATAIEVAALAVSCGWFAERMLGSDGHGWFVPVLSGFSGLYLGPHLALILGWHWGPSVAGRLVAPIFIGTLIACIFVRLLTLGLAGARR